jgi:hypothetical protein
VDSEQVRRELDAMRERLTAELEPHLIRSPEDLDGSIRAVLGVIAGDDNVGEIVHEPGGDVRVQLTLPAWLVERMEGHG